MTKDENFHRLSVLLGPPPKVMLGNCSTDDVIRLLQAALPLDCYRTRVVEFGWKTIRSADWHGEATLRSLKTKHTIANFCKCLPSSPG